MHKIALPGGDGTPKSSTPQNAAPLETTLENLAHVDCQRLGAGVKMFPGGQAWLGALVPKRWAKRAVTRNAIKRQIYNVSAVLAPTLAEAAYVVRLRGQFDKKYFPSASSAALKTLVAHELLSLFEKNGIARMTHPLRGAVSTGPK